jgi:hypothetical protein
VDLLAACAAGGNKLTVEIARSLLGRQHVVAAIAKCSLPSQLSIKVSLRPSPLPAYLSERQQCHAHPWSVVLRCSTLAFPCQASLVRLYTQLWLASSAEDSTVHDDTWRVVSSVMADLQQAVHRPSSALTFTATSTYAAFVLAYTEAPGAAGVAVFSSIVLFASPLVLVDVGTFARCRSRQASVLMSCVCFAMQLVWFPTAVQRKWSPATCPCCGLPCLKPQRHSNGVWSPHVLLPGWHCCSVVRV